MKPPCACDPDHAEAHQGLSYVLAELGRRRARRLAPPQGFRASRRAALAVSGRRPAGIRCCCWFPRVGGNIPTRNFLDDRVFQTTVVVPEFYDFSLPLPPHQLVFNAIGDADLDGEALAAAQSLAALSGAPVLNPPVGGDGHGPRRQCAAARAPARRDRAGHCHAAARAVCLAPDAAAALARHGLHFPLLLRTPGFHTGRHFVRVERAGSAGRGRGSACPARN